MLFALNSFGENSFELNNTQFGPDYCLIEGIRNSDGSNFVSEEHSDLQERANTNYVSRKLGKMIGAEILHRESYFRRKANVKFHEAFFAQGTLGGRLGVYDDNGNLRPLVNEIKSWSGFVLEKLGCPNIPALGLALKQVDFVLEKAIRSAAGTRFGKFEDFVSHMFAKAENKIFDSLNSNSAKNSVSSSQSPNTSEANSQTTEEIFDIIERHIPCQGNPNADESYVKEICKYALYTFKNELNNAISSAKKFVIDEANREVKRKIEIWANRGATFATAVSRMLVAPNFWVVGGVAVGYYYGLPILQNLSSAILNSAGNFVSNKIPNLFEISGDDHCKFNSISSHEDEEGFEVLDKGNFLLDKIRQRANLAAEKVEEDKMKRTRVRKNPVLGEIRKTDRSAHFVGLFKGAKALIWGS